MKTFKEEIKMDNNEVMQTTDVQENVGTEVTATEQPSGKGKAIFFGVLAVVVLGPIAAIVFAVLWIRNKNQKKQLQAELDAEKAKNAATTAPAAPVAPAEASVETKADTPAETK